jgi:hypothetical protein
MKQFLFAAAGLFAFANVNAQNTVTLNVNLKPVQTLIVTTGLNNVDLTYQTEGDYTNGVSKKMDDQLTIYSTGSYEVSVSTNDATMTQGSKTMNVSSIQVIPTSGTNGPENAIYTAQSLSNNPNTLVTSTTGAVKKQISIEYKGANANAYIDNYIAGQDPTTYTTTLTYLIVSK